MADLETLLLEAAGRTGKNRHSSPPSKKRRTGSYYDDSSVRDDDSIGSDLYKDEEDRQKLARMSELDREMILEERATKRMDRKLQEDVRKRNEKMARLSKYFHPLPQISCDVPSSTRSAPVAADKDRGSSVSNELRAKRQGKLDFKTTHRNLRSSRKLDFKATRRNLRSSSSHTESGSSSDDTNSSVGSTIIPTFEDIQEITIRRSKLEKLFMEPFFEDLIAGCFVRVGIGRSRFGPVYRLCIVKDVDASDPNKKYKFGDKTTNKYLNVYWGKESTAARWQMAMMSDSPPLKEEYDLWVKEVERSGGYMPSIEDVIEKKNAIEKTIKTFVYTAEIVKKMLDGKQTRPLNVAAEKDRLRMEMEVAESKNDEVAVERIIERLKELEEKQKANYDGSSKKITRIVEELNRRNKMDNLRSACAKNEDVKKNLNDPCSRRWTKSRNYTFPGMHVEEAKDAPASNGITPTSAAAEVAVISAASEAVVDRWKSVDLYEVHNFDLPISLSALYAFGGPKGVQVASVARRQKIETTIGCQEPKNDRSGHEQTMTIDEYKRRRGLLI